MLLRNDSLYSIQKQKAIDVQKELRSSSFVTDIRLGKFSESFAKKLGIMQLRYNFEFIAALCSMRHLFQEHGEFIVSFVDPHIATEFGAGLAIVDFEQNSISHIKMIYDFVDSLGIERSELDIAVPELDYFFDSAIRKLIGGNNKAIALGALFADEVLANVWFSAMHEGLVNFSAQHDLKLDLEFFRSHADDIEPAHEEHAMILYSYSSRYQLDKNLFDHGISTFENSLLGLFTALHQEIS